ncbi:hypothetical protein PR202_ga01983 [Eleusine coracana subsp. coracana]|uniref:Uncharacterized protein n=1 Tax=Eleusine coracana subsp. coracana TaxID=191504 RepID=A0AAV5BIL3_ELECO|nr:hypothetical protein PR202_ga01296 [Eleusine coracana subsp. coracana]GJM86153.1 hypothetical protein PR202_ga01983 [Eleusine coracana subsp. coracana]
MEQLVTAREEREQVIVEASNEISSEKKKARELQRKLDDANKKVTKLTADNAGLREAVDAKDALVGELRASEAAARDELAGAAARLESAQKQAGSLKYEVRMLQKELEVRAQEREYDLKAADAARRQQAEHLDRIARLEAECQRLRAMVRKRLPGPAAIAKMRDEVDQQQPQQTLTPRASPRRPRPATPSSPRSVASSPFTPRTPSPRRSVSSEADGYAFKLRAMEDENRALKQALAKRESELQIVQMKYADEACRFTAAQRQLKNLTEENRQLSDANCQSESWASALISELEQFRSGPECPTAEASVKDWAAQEEELLTAILNLQTLHFLQNSDIQAAADKLAECQETITILNKQLQALTTPATYKPQSLASILAEGSADANGSKSPTTSKQVQFKEEHDAFSAVPKMSSEQEQNATTENKDSIQIVVHPVFGEPRQEGVSADPGKKKKRSSSLLGRIMFRKKVEGSS